MRILHFSDLHIGVENYGKTDPQTGLSTRLLDFLSTLDQLVEYALNEGVDLVLFAGDAYKGRDPSQTHQREFALRIARLTSAGIPVFLLVGNHDLPHAVGRATAVDIYRTLQVPNIHVGDKLDVYPVETRAGPLQIVALPWPRRSTLLSREESRGLTMEQARQAIEDRLTKGVQGCVDRLDPSVPAVLTGHLTINGATVGTERSMMLGRDHALYPSAVHQPQLEYVALGHVHRHQVLREGPIMVYSGSLQRVDFSEERDTKGFCVVDLDPTAPQGRRMRDFSFQQVDARPFITVDADIRPGDMDPTQTVINSVLRHHVAESIVRVRVSLPAEASPQLRDSEVMRALEKAHYVAAISREVQEERRTRIPASVAEGLGPMEALRLYFESRAVDSARRDVLLRYADELVAENISEESAE